jgi:predicted metal-dependent phosphotriesterase family hydrolase
MAYLAVQISVNKPSGKKGISNVREALTLAMDQVEILLENLQMVDPSIIFLPHKAKDRVGVESEMIATAEHAHANYDSMGKYFPQFYVHRNGTYM